MQMQMQRKRMLGIYLMHERQFSEAESVLTEAWHLDRDEPTTVIRLAELCRARGQLVEATEFLQEAVRLCPLNPVVHAQLGLTYALQRNRLPVCRYFRNQTMGPGTLRERPGGAGESTEHLRGTGRRAGGRPPAFSGGRLVDGSRGYEAAPRLCLGTRSHREDAAGR